MSPAIKLTLCAGHQSTMSGRRVSKSKKVGKKERGDLLEKISGGMKGNERH